MLCARQTQEGVFADRWDDDRSNRSTIATYRPEIGHTWFGPDQMQTRLNRHLDLPRAGPNISRRASRSYPLAKSDASARRMPRQSLWCCDQHHTTLRPFTGQSVHLFALVPKGRAKAAARCSGWSCQTQDQLGPSQKREYLLGLVYLDKFRPIGGNSIVAMGYKGPTRRGCNP
jgi:hypothetical protein